MNEKGRGSLIYQRGSAGVETDGVGESRSTKPSFQSARELDEAMGRCARCWRSCSRAKVGERRRGVAGIEREARRRQRKCTAKWEQPGGRGEARSEGNERGEGGV